MVKLVLEENGRIWDETFISDSNVDQKIAILNQTAIALGASARWKRADVSTLDRLDDAFKMIIDICKKFDLAMVALLCERSHVGSLGRQHIYCVEPHWMPREYMQILKDFAPESLDSANGVTYLTPITLSKN